MSLLITVLMFFGIAVAGAMFGMKMYVRPKEAMDRVVGNAMPCNRRYDGYSCQLDEACDRGSGDSGTNRAACRATVNARTKTKTEGQPYWEWLGHHSSVWEHRC